MSRLIKVLNIREIKGFESEGALLIISLNKMLLHYPAGIYLLKVNNRDTEIRCEISSKLTVKTPERRQACNFIKKETLTKVFSCEFYEISKNTFSYWTPPVAASVVWEVDSGILHYFNGQNVKPATGGVL